MKYSISDIDKIIDYKESIKKKLSKSLKILGNKTINKNFETIPYFLIFNPRLSPSELVELLIYQKKIWKELPFLFWPDLPPEVLNNYSSHFQANYLLNTIVFLPLHQSTKIRSLRNTH